MIKIAVEIKNKIIYHLHTLKTCLMSILRFTLRNKVTLPLLELYFGDQAFKGAGQKYWCCSVFNGMNSNFFEGEQNNCHLKNLILTLLYMYIEVYKFICLFGHFKFKL